MTTRLARPPRGHQHAAPLAPVTRPRWASTLRSGPLPAVGACALVVALACAPLPPAPAAAPAAQEPAAPPPPAEPPLPSGPLLDERGPRLPEAIGLSSLGLPRERAESALPALFADGGATFTASGPRVEPIFDRDSQTLTGLKLTYADAAALEAVVASWEAPSYVLRAGHCARVWLGEGGVRALVAELRRAPVGRCPVPDERPDLTQSELLLEEYWTVDELLPEGTPRFGFESGAPVMGQTLEELSSTLSSRLHRSSEEAGGGYFAVLPPLNLAQSPTYASFELGGGRVRLIRIELPAVSNDPELAPESLLARLESRWGPLTPVEPHVRLVSQSEPSVEVNVLGGPVSSITLRDAPNCPAESVLEAEAAVKSLGDRWIEARQAKAPPAGPNGPKPGYVNRGYRLGRRPAALVHEKVYSSKCTDNYWILRRDKPECEPETIDEELWGSDCCDARCEAEPELWMMRLYNAVQGKDEKLFARLIPPGGEVSIVTRRAGEPEGSGRVFEVTAATLNRQTFERFPDWSPHGDGVACSALPDGRTRCEAGPARYHTRFTWSGPPDAMVLDEVVLETQ